MKPRAQTATIKREFVIQEPSTTLNSTKADYNTLQQKSSTCVSSTKSKRPVSFISYKPSITQCKVELTSNPRIEAHDSKAEQKLLKSFNQQVQH